MNVLYIIINNYSLPIEVLLILRKVHSELQKLIDNPKNGNINSKNLYDYIYHHPFTKGLIYQLLKDYYKSGIDRRKYAIKNLIQSDFEDHDARLSWAIQYNGGKWINNWNFYKSMNELILFLDIVNKNMDNGLKNPKYFGQCIQFLLDINHKQSYEPSELINYDAIISNAEGEWYRINYPKKNKIVYHNYCDDCNTWNPSERRCKCGNRRLEWECYDHNLNNIPDFYVSPY